MIIYGIRGKVISGEPVRNVECQHCGNDAHISFGVLRYVHIYWIPTFLFARKTGLECVHCKQTIFDDEMPKDVHARIANQLFTTKNVLPMFSGLAIIIAFFLFMAIAS